MIADRRTDLTAALGHAPTSFPASQMFVRFVFSSLYTYHEGNPFSQMIHDGATLKDHGKRLAIGAELIMINPRYIPRTMLDLTQPSPPASRASALIEAAQGGKEEVAAKATPHKPEYDKPPQQVRIIFPYVFELGVTQAIHTPFIHGMVASCSTAMAHRHRRACIFALQRDGTLMVRATAPVMSCFLHAADLAVSRHEAAAGQHGQDRRPAA